ncbi:MAG: T9SS type A sorting domain-containing protein [Bacteroidetes bacterium]|nr:T9SS type A sorting domain-containing protein [Bacteroidota bacterium]
MKGIKETSNADYIATGIGDFITFGYRAPLIKIDSSGNLLWKKEIGFGLVDTYGNSLIITNNNEYVIGGEDNDFFGYDALIFKTDSNGNVLWYQYHGGDKTNDGAKSVVSTPDGGYVLLGWTEESEGGGVYDIFMVKTDNNGCSPSAKAGQDLVICKNASIQLNARGMNKDDTYSWNPAAGLSNSTIYNPMATPLVTTQYILTVSSSCATAEDTILITVNPLPTITVSADTTICPGDSASLTATGGSSYLWSPQSGLNNNAISNPKTSPSTTVTYTVMVTDTNSCMNSATVKVSLHTTPSVTFQGLDSTYCLDAPNDSLQGTPANGLFSGNGMTGNIFNPATAGVGTHLIYYSYTDSNNCVLTDTQNTVILSLDTPGIFVIGSLDFCDGDSVQIYEFIFPDYCDFLWSTGDTTDYLVIYTPGNYSVIVSGNGVNCPNCPTSSDSVTVIINPDPPKPVLTQSGNNLTCSVAGMTYEWYLNNVPLFGPNVQTYTATQSGLYHVMITDTNGCQSFSDTVSVTTYIWELSDQGHVQIYPNPFHYYTTVYIPEIFIKNKVLSLEIYNLFGRLVGKQVLNKEQTIIDRNSFSNGCYLFRILENSGELGHGVVMIY